MSTQPPEDWNDLTAPADEVTRYDSPAPRKPKPRRRLLSVLFVISAAALAVVWLNQFNPLAYGPDKADLIQGRKAALQLAGKAIRDYAQRHGYYPDKLEDAIVLSPELQIEYTKSESGFELGTANSR